MMTTQEFDDLAQRFYRDTGIMAPGKSVPMAMGGDQPDDAERDQAWRDWLAESKNTEVRDPQPARVANGND